MKPTSSTPMTYRDLLRQRGQQLLSQLTAQGQQQPQSVIPLESAMQPSQTDTPSAQLGQQNTLKNYASAQKLVPGSSPSAMIGPEPKNAQMALADQGDQAFNQFCQKFVEQATLGHSGVFPSAIAAWNAQQGNARPGFDGIQPGDLVYFGADQSNGNQGHTGIYTGNGNFVSATDNGVKQVPLTNWIQSTGQNYLGYIPASAVGDPSGQGAAGRGGGNIFGAIGNAVRNGIGNFAKGYGENSQQGLNAPPMGLESFGNFLANDGLGEATGMIGQGLHTLGSMAHIAPNVAHSAGMMPGIASGLMGGITTGQKFLKDVGPAEEHAVQVSNVPGIKYLPIDSLISHEGAPDANRVAMNVALAKQGGEIPPLLTTKDGDGFGVLDGAHRLEAFRQLGQKFVPTINMANTSPETLNAYNQVLDQANNRMKGLPQPPATFNVPYMGNR